MCLNQPWYQPYLQYVVAWRCSCSVYNVIVIALLRLLDLKGALSHVASWLAI